MPGVRQEDIKLDLKEDILDISVQSGDRKYHKEVLLPVKALSENLSSFYKNGILEVKQNCKAILRRPAEAPMAGSRAGIVSCYHDKEINRECKRLSAGLLWIQTDGF